MRQIILPVVTFVGAIALLAACDSNNNQAANDNDTPVHSQRANRISSEELGAIHYDALVQLLTDVQSAEAGSGKTPLDGRNLAKKSCNRFFKQQQSALFSSVDCGPVMDAFQEFTDRHAKSTSTYGAGVLSALTASDVYSGDQVLAIGEVMQILESTDWESEEKAAETVSRKLDAVLENSRQSLTASELVAVHDVIEVARGSAAFWSEFTDDLIVAYADMYGVMLDVELGKDVVLACKIGSYLGFSCAGVALADVGGAAGGAAVGLIFGPTVLAGAGGGAVAGSVENGVSQILSLFNN